MVADYVNFHVRRATARTGSTYTALTLGSFCHIPTVPTHACTHRRDANLSQERVSGRVEEAKQQLEVIALVQLLVPPAGLVLRLKKQLGVP